MLAVEFNVQTTDAYVLENAGNYDVVLSFLEFAQASDE